MAPPFGLGGGGPGGPSRVLLISPDGRERVLNTKGTFTEPPGAQIVMRAPGSGGYGPPSERDPARLREDVINGYVTAEGEPACPACDRSGRASPIAR